MVVLTCKGTLYEGVYTSLLTECTSQWMPAFEETFYGLEINLPINGDLLANVLKHLCHLQPLLSKLFYQSLICASFVAECFLFDVKVCRRLAF